MADTTEQNDNDQQHTAEGDSSHDEQQTDDGEHLYEDWDELAADPEEVSRLGRALEGLLPDILKRGFDGLVSEDGLRSLVRQKELPREAVGFILGQVDATKREVLRIVSREIRVFLEDVDLGGELTKILTSVSFEIRTEVRFIPNDAAVRPDVRNRVRMRGRDGEEKTLSESDPPPEVDDDRQGDEDAGDGEEDVSREDASGKSRRRWGFGRRRNRDDDEDSGAESESPG